MIKDKVVIITGASSGIGYATAKILAQSGAKVAVGARRLDRLEKLQKECEEFTKENMIITEEDYDEENDRVAPETSQYIENQRILISQLDVTKKSECDSFVTKVIEKWGQVDVIVNNAGLMPLSFIKNLKIDEWDRMVDVNIKGVLYCTAAVLPTMLEKKSGHIINISSVAGRIVFPAGSIYCATKHAVTAFTEGLRQELSPRKNIRVTSIEPGVVETELTNTITDESLEKFVETSKQMEALKAEDIANAIVFAIDAPNHMNVNEILVRPTTQDR